MALDKASEKVYRDLYDNGLVRLVNVDNVILPVSTDGFIETLSGIGPFRPEVTAVALTDQGVEQMNKMLAELYRNYQRIGGGRSYVDWAQVHLSKTLPPGTPGFRVLAELWNLNLIREAQIEHLLTTVHPNEVAQ